MSLALLQPAPGGRCDREEIRACYRLPNWSQGYFDVLPNGHLAARPFRDPGRAEIDLYALAGEVRERGLPCPVLLRFPDILADRARLLEDAFRQARRRHAYRADCQAAYPVKVNQKRRVVEAILRGGRVGLEVGSKAELMLALALAAKGTLLVCNGYKDRDYLRLALVGIRMGLRVFIVLERLCEFQSLRQAAREVSAVPRLGLRVRLHSIAAGNWQNTGGEKSKFGMHPGEVLRTTQMLREAGWLGRLQLLHFHIGSQVSDIRDFQRALREGARYYAELRRLGAPVAWVDVGGGLGVDYDGTASRGADSANYGMEEYAATVLRELAAVCRARELPQPNVITECGRAMTAHHALLVTEALEVERAPGPPARAAVAGRAASRLAGELRETLAGLAPGKAARACRDAGRCREEARALFLRGLLGLDALAVVEELYYAVCRRACALLGADCRERVPGLEERLADKYLCNFSLFQALPDSWALGQVFPVVPLHRLDEWPERRGTLHDLTCDSDGRIDRYAVAGESSLPLHRPRPGERYLLGIFLLGAYQEVLGDMHNLFGATASLDVRCTGGGYRIEGAWPGDSAADLMRRLDMPPALLAERYLRRLRAAGLPAAELRDYRKLLAAGLDGYTYLARQ